MKPVASNSQMGPGQTKKSPAKFTEWQVDGGRGECVHTQCWLCSDLNHTNLSSALKKKNHSPASKMCLSVLLAHGFDGLTPVSPPESLFLARLP